nr:DUF3108 domain-containing protein [Caenimonas aquaedulcis]
MLLRAAPAVVVPDSAQHLRPLVIRTFAPESAAPPPTPQAPPVVAAIASVEAPAPNVVRRPSAAPRTLSSPRIVSPGAQPPAPPERVAAVTPPAKAHSSAQRATKVAVADSMRLRYRVDVRVRGIPLQGEGLLVWRREGDGYEAQLEVSSPIYPKRTQRSTGRITADGIAPTRFSDKGRGSEEAAHFERDKDIVSFSGNHPEAPLQAGAQDRLTVILQLGALLAGEPARYPQGATITIQTAGTRDAEPWSFTVEGEEDLTLPGGKVTAVKLQRNPRKEFDQKVELWLAPGMAYAPVRVRLTQPNGDWVDQQWSSTDRG